MKRTLITLVLIISAGTLCAQAMYKYDDASSFSDGLAEVVLKGKHGFIDQSGKVVVPLEYDYVEEFSEGLALVKKDEKYGFTDKTGKIVVPLIYDEVHSFSEGLAMVEKHWKYGFIDQKGKEVIPIEYEFAFNDFHEGLAPIEKYDDDKVGVINKKNKVIVPFEYDDIDDFEHGYTYIEKDKKLGIVHKDGKITVPIVYDNVYPEFYNGQTIFVASNKQQKEVTIFDEKVREILHLNGYTEGYFFSDGLLSFADDNGQWGVVNMKGETILPFRYQRIVVREGGLLKVKENDKWGLCIASRTTAHTIVEPKYEQFGSFCEGLAEVALKGKHGFIDTSGKVIIPLEYDDAGFFREGFAPVSKFGKWGYIDKTGKLISLEN